MIDERSLPELPDELVQQLRQSREWESMFLMCLIRREVPAAQTGMVEGPMGVGTVEGTPATGSTDPHDGGGTSWEDGVEVLNSVFQLFLSVHNTHSVC